MEDEEEDIIISEGITWDKPFYALNGLPFVPMIFDGPPADLQGKFNAVTIQIDGRLQADLSWSEARVQAFQAIERRLAILWEIDLSLFSRLRFPLEHQSQYLSLRLSVEHFRDTLWKEFGSSSLGLVLFRGSAEELFVNRDAALEYMALLGGCLPDTAARYLLVEVPLGWNPMFQAQFFHPDHFEQFNLIIKGSSLPFRSIGWDKPLFHGYFGKESAAIQPHIDVKTGLCLSLKEKQYPGLENPLNHLLAEKIPFKIISESHLTTEWDGLDYLICVPTDLSAEGMRKLQGFCAAGGHVVSLGGKANFDNEIDWDKWIVSHS